MHPAHRAPLTPSHAPGLIATVLIALAGLAWAKPPCAQDWATSSEDPGPDTVLNGLTLEHSGWYLAPTLGVSSIQGHVAATSGGRGAWRVNRSFGLGLAGTGFMSDGGLIDDAADGAQREFQGGYGGVLLEWIIGSNRAVHGLLDATIGAGGGCIDTYGDGEGCKSARAFFVAEPSASVEVNVLRFMRVAAGGG